ncbi:MAG: hypothetical protein O7F73_02330, partial [Gammaproteobacteria bacterium]|nr:hypothetical protein [Gammaproteobacteria bacterium]
LLNEDDIAGEIGEVTLYGLVLEQVYLNPTQQKVAFIGAAEIPDLDRNLLRAGAGQPLFHVEHSIDGDESQPLNRWRIAHLTNKLKQGLTERFTLMANDVWLPEFIEIYIRNDLNIRLTRRDVSPQECKFSI